MTDYVLAQSHEQTTPCIECGVPATVASTTLAEKGFAWCIEHFVEQVRGVEAHRIAREGHEDEVDLLLSVLHTVYHILYGYATGRVVQAMAVIEEAAKRWPECSEMPLAEEEA